MERLDARSCEESYMAFLEAIKAYKSDRLGAKEHISPTYCSTMKNKYCISNTDAL